MNQLVIWMTEPTLTNESSVWFSAYGFGWGFRAFALSYEALCESLGAGDTSDQQINLAFQLGRRRILQAVQQHEWLPYQGDRIWISLAESPADSSVPEALAQDDQ
jgi:hypothetical protein